MLRVGLTGDLGSGKSTVAAMLAARGAVVLSSDEMARATMRPGEAVYKAILARFGAEVVSADGTLDRRRLARLAFDESKPRAAELNAIVHPAVLAEQAKRVAALAETDATVVIESALVFSAYGQTAERRRERFDRILLVVASEAQKVSRFVERTLQGRTASAGEVTALEADARRRLALQHSEDHAAECLVLTNDGPLAELEAQVGRVWRTLHGCAADR